MSQSNGNKRSENDQPIHTPPPESDKHWLEPEFGPISPSQHVSRAVFDIIRWPADWFRKNVVEPNRGPKYYWYHRKYARALPIDECYMDDDACFYEANLEFIRIRQVDRATLELLKVRRDACYYYYKDEKGLEQMKSDRCKDITDTFFREEENFFIKYGELPFRANVVNAYTKQKHRMIVERRRAQKQREFN